MTAAPASPAVDRRHGPRRWWALAAFLAAVTVTAAVGVLGVSGTADEYAGLDQPSWAPPSWLFGPVWTLLYVLIAIAGWLAWQRIGFTGPLWAYAAQLVLNAVWTPLFFGAGRYGMAFADIVILWALVVVTTVAFLRVRRSAGYLLLPYLAWVTFAAALNFAIWQLNT
ncbi:TspO/MBR family protein [Hamadaea sp. NPDC050747]|uniref:TspO/MBR family protein n=1 Tax=Hamadaea sp. NPDC050747 TaxID=3155789 RepID=UPI0033D8E574